MQLYIMSLSVCVKDVSNEQLTADILPLNHSPNCSHINGNILYKQLSSILRLRLSRLSGILSTEPFPSGRTLAWQ